MTSVLTIVPNWLIALVFTALSTCYAYMAVRECCDTPEQRRANAAVALGWFALAFFRAVVQVFGEAAELIDTVRVLSRVCELTLGLSYIMHVDGNWGDMLRSIRQAVVSVWSKTS